LKSNLGEFRCDWFVACVEGKTKALMQQNCEAPISVSQRKPTLCDLLDDVIASSLACILIREPLGFWWFESFVEVLEERHGAAALLLLQTPHTSSSLQRASIHGTLESHTGTESLQST
jgi:hypothetical protein